MLKKALLAGFALLPLSSSSAPLTTISINNSNIVKLIENPIELDEEGECTFMYVGKKVSADGKAHVARSGDSSPNTMNMYSKVFKRNELANKTVYGKNGFEYKLPSYSHKYISTPRNPNMGKGLNWEVSAINEKGVAVSATLTCATHNGALAVDPFVKKGISEDNIAQIVGAVASTAKEGIQYIANIMDTIGSAEPNAIMVMDKDEVWYMEMYTGHQYVAVKMPEDKACTIGNEFLLDTLEDFADEDIITSKDILTLPVENNFAVFKSGTVTGTLKTLDLFHTYGGEEDIQGGLVDSCHMRTWIGRYRFAYENDAKEGHAEYHKYATNTKYPAFFTPDRLLDENDIISYMRDRYETILFNKEDPNYAYFKAKYDNNELRYVGTESAYQIHIMSVDPDLPSEIAIEELLCLSNSNYSPFIPINNGLNSLCDYYTYMIPDYSYDLKSASCIYKRLNTLCALNREYFGMPVVKFIEEHEKIWQQQYKDIISQVKSMDLDKAQNILTNWSNEVQLTALSMSEILFEDLLLHIENITKSYHPEIKEFKPYVHLDVYSWFYGWSFSRKDKEVTLTNGIEKIVINLDYKGQAPVSKLTYYIDGTPSEERELNVQIKSGETYADYETMKEFITKGHAIYKVNAEDYYSVKKNNLLWIIPTAILVPALAAGIATPLILKKKAEKASASKNKKK